MMITYKEGTIVLLYVPFDMDLDDTQRKVIDDILFQYQLPSPSWDTYNDMFEGYILDDQTYEADISSDNMNDDDHLESYFNISSTFEEVSKKLQDAIGHSEIMVCEGSTGFYELPFAA